MGLLQDLKLYYGYKKTLKENKDGLLSKFNIKIDNADRMYTVVNLPQDFFEEPYNLRKSDIDLVAEQYIKEYISKLSEYLDSIGLREMYGYYESTQKVEKYSYLIVIGFKNINSVEYNTLIYRRLLPFIGVSAVIGLLLGLLL